MRAGIGVQELDKVLLGTRALVGEGLRGAALEELDCGVGADVLGFGEGLAVLGFGVDFSNQDGGFLGEVGGEGFPSGGEGFAVCDFVLLALPPKVSLYGGTGIEWRGSDIRPHHGAVNATSTSWSLPTFSSKLLLSSITT